MTTTAKPSTLGGPVSIFLEEDIRSWVRRHGIVFWLDAAGHYTEFVQRLQQIEAEGRLSYRVQAFRGSYLELMAALEPITDGVLPPKLLVYLPGFTEDRVHESPLLELYLAGARYRRALPTLVAEAAAGNVPPAEVEAFVEDGDPGLEDADAWLELRIETADSALAAKLRHLPPETLVTALLRGDEPARVVVKNREARELFFSHVASVLGLTREWWTELGGDRDDASAQDLAFLAASWALVTEYVDDLRRSPSQSLLQPAEGLSRKLVGNGRSLAHELRQQQPDFYTRTADETEAWLEEEIAGAEAEDLGEIDTFRFEDEKVLEATFKAVGEQAWSTAEDYARARLDSPSVWLERDPGRQAAWMLLAGIARLGMQIEAAGALDPQGAPETHLVDYADRGAAADRAHRELEQLRVERLHPGNTHFVHLRSVLDEARALWREWADQWARVFNAACRREGFLGQPSIQQRTLFDDVVLPLTRESSGPTVFFVVDALRFEMAQTLVEKLSTPAATSIQLEPRLAELPTVTSVGMNVLAPVASGGKLRPVIEDSNIQGFHTGHFTVRDPKSRQRQMQARAGGNTCPWLELDEVVERDASSLQRSLKGSRLLTVHSREIDQGGESEVGPLVFERLLQKLLAAWRLLREAGARSFVFTADHGFLLLDNRDRMAQSHGRKVDPKRRHVLSKVAADHEGEVRVSLQDLAYEDEEWHLMFPESTAVFDTGKHRHRFVHGGNSLQERVIPVLTITHRSQAGGTNFSYRIEAERTEPLGSFHSLEGLVEVTEQQQLAFSTPEHLEIDLRVPEDPSILVEVQQVRGPSARLEGGVVLARPGEPFHLFFRLQGRSRRQVAVELYHPAGRAEVTPCLISDRYAVSPTGGGPKQEAAGEAKAETGSDWLQELPEGGIRRLFAHIDRHGSAAEPEAVGFLGSARAVRRFSNRLEEYARKAPFLVRVEVIGGVKRYVKEG